MRCVQSVANILCLIMLLSSVDVSGKVFDTRCKLVRELIKVGIPNDLFLGQWVCLIEKESNRDTNAFIETSSGKKFYGLYQIPHRWCREGKKGGDCNLACEYCSRSLYSLPEHVKNSLLDDDIRDDSACAVNIFHREGFKYWPKWTARCKNDNFITTEIYKCPDLSSRSPILERSESLRQRRQHSRVGMERLVSPVPRSYAMKYLMEALHV